MGGGIRIPGPARLSSAVNRSDSCGMPAQLPRRLARQPLLEYHSLVPQ